LLGLSPHNWATVLNQIDVVVHAAAVVDRLAPLYILRAVNCTAVARVAELSTQANVPLHFISSSAALPPVGTIAGDRIRIWPTKGGLWTKALEGSMYTRDVHGGSWEGYAQSKWIGEQIVFDRLQLAGSVVHRFGNLSGNEDLVATLAISVSIKSLPRDLNYIEWLSIDSVATGIAASVLHEDYKAVGKVVHHSKRVPAKAVWIELMQNRGDGERVITSEWCRRVSTSLEEGTTKLGNNVLERISALLAIPSGLEGAIGLCERLIESASVGDTASCIAAVERVLKS